MEKNKISVFMSPTNISVDCSVKNRVTLYRLDDDVEIYLGEYQVDLNLWPKVTVGELRAYLREKAAQAEAAEVAARQATETPAPPTEIPVTLPQAGDVEVIRDMEPATTLVPPADGPVTTPVTRYEDTEGGDNEHGVAQPIDEL